MFFAVLKLLEFIVFKCYDTLIERKRVLLATKYKAKPQAVINVQSICMGGAA